MLDPSSLTHSFKIILNDIKQLLVDRLFLRLMAVDGRNPSNREDLKQYWHHLQIEGIDPTQVYEELLVKLGVLPPPVADIEVHVTVM